MGLYSVKLNSIPQRIVQNLRDDHHGKPVNLPCALRGVDFSDGLEVLKELMREGIVRKREVGGYPLYRYNMSRELGSRIDRNISLVNKGK